MLTEADLNRIKGLLHFLNGNKPASRGDGPLPEAGGRRLQVADPARAGGASSTVTFEVVVRNSHGEPVGRISKPGDEYVFGIVGVG